MKYLLMALMFLIRTPFYVDLKPSEKDFSRCTAFFPLVGVILGALITVVYYIAVPLGKEIAALIALTVYVYLALGFHLDGLADCFDGLASGKRGEELINIMKDSRIGTFAAISVFLALMSYLKLFTYVDYKTLLVFPVIGRCTMTIVASIYKPARKEGLGYLFSRDAGIKEFIIASVITLITGIIVLNIKFILPAIFAVIFALIFTKNISSRMDGINGDILGASLVLSEVMFLLAGHIEGMIV
ncbi:MAG: adenosylcobinamide-GDP ribazoletransferase [Thermoanaerobacteraceae bacterium]|nr:adenosylcobinamide-GDP ribazoletransferase [Thermoanaerobacteraceae bacterium]